jgi:DHA1 family tetracycline resistance protein-like MFS transporter
MSSAAPDPDVSPDPNPSRAALGVIFLIVFLDLLGFGVIIPLLPFYAMKYQASALQVTILFSIYSICQFIAAPILGSLSDRHGRRPVLIVSQLGSSLGYVLLGVVTMMEWHDAALALGLIYLSRVIDGFSGGNISTAQAYISDVTTPQTRAKGMGLIGAAFGIGFAAGPAIGGLLGGKGHESWPAFAAAIFCFLATVLTYLKLPESRHVASAANLAMTTTAEQDIASPVLNYARPGLFERTGISMLLRRPVLLQLLLISFVSMAAFVMMESSIALFLSRPDSFNFGPAQVGWFFAFIGVIIAIVQGGLIGRLTKLTGEWPLAIAGPILVAVAMGCFARTGWTPILALLLAGGAANAIGRSLQQPTLSSLVSKFSDPREQGIVFGLFHSLSSLARVIGPVVAGLVYETHPTGPFVVAGVVVLAAALWTVALAASAPVRSAAASATSSPADAGVT